MCFPQIEMLSGVHESGQIPRHSHQSASTISSRSCNVFTERSDSHSGKFASRVVICRHLLPLNLMRNSICIYNEIQAISAVKGNANVRVDIYIYIYVCVYVCIHICCLECT